MLIIKMEGGEGVMDHYLLHVLNTACVLFNAIYKTFN